MSKETEIKKISKEIEELQAKILEVLQNEKYTDGVVILALTNLLIAVLIVLPEKESKEFKTQIKKYINSVL